MTRLTEKIENEDYNFSKELNLIPNVPSIKAAELVKNKLGQLEDIEDELGIDLITLFKALKDGIYVKVNRKIDFIRYVSIFKKRKRHLYSSSTFWGKYDIGLIKDYGKTWALTKEELL